MYTPLNLLPDSVAINNRRNNYRRRWESVDGKKLATKIVGEISERTGPDFLDKDFADHKLGFLETSSELRGLPIEGVNVVFPDGPNFQGMNLNYWTARDDIFTHAAFTGSTSNFATFSGVHFTSCTFIGFGLYGSEFEDCVFEDCNFLDRNTFSNCSFKNVTFKGCFFETDSFVDCKFDELTTVNHPVKQSRPVSVAHNETVTFNPEYLAAFYRGVKEAYEAGRISHQQRRYIYAEKHALTRHNTPPGGYQLARRFLEATTGYGIKPIRVLVSALLIFAVSATIFTTRFGDGGFLLAAGGFLTFGANTDLLGQGGHLYQALYVLFAFLGVTTTSTFIVVLTNYWASLR